MADSPDKTQKNKKRLTSDERRQAILEAAIPLFARQGFRGVTTRHLAEEAGVSEALLYQHFPSKDALYGEVQDQFCRCPPALEAALAEAEPSTTTLIQLLALIARVLIDPPAGSEPSPYLPRMMLQSVLDDGAFARLLQERTLRSFGELVARSAEAARRSGDLEASAGPGMDALRFWLAHHVFTMIHVNRLPGQPFLGYPEKQEQLLQEALLFVLRGLGLTESAIERCYHPDELRQTLARWLAGPQNVLPSPSAVTATSDLAQQLED